ncbi:hypothetical protein SDC9_211893 [bioreactor metagenome]|uniref:Uncharacterized protein n=1 Tax=bioreactor metagenome TaxID=1076179 RepID=A0A645JLI3_9ZZZZ
MELDLVDSLRLHNEYLLMACFIHLFPIQGQLLIQLFTRADPTKFDFYVSFRFISGKSEQIARQVIDPDLFPHIKDKGLAPACLSCRLQHQGHGFHNGHKISAHFGICNGNGPPFCICLLKVGTTLPLEPRTFPNRTAAISVFALDSA